MAGINQHLEGPPVSRSSRLPTVVQTSSFNTGLVNQLCLPASMRLVRGLLDRMQEHMRDIIDENYAKTAAGTDVSSARVNHLQGPSHYKLSLLVAHIYRALTDNGLEFRSQEPSEHRRVITDHSYRLGDQIKILGEDKSSHVFMRELMTQNQVLNPLQDSTNKYTSYEAILGKGDLGSTARVTPTPEKRSRWRRVYNARETYDNRRLSGSDSRSYVARQIGETMCPFRTRIMISKAAYR
ncbi:hypothetical protein F5148DRAFT_1366736 [Russula earlei]|uniref:Uncharacterized protein n=1 Tax=Russula earlei TaxID=71964 RepID=A0ACC0UEU8_9AGAM|nr:hypothetical protein F5148DRAFT_1366736 [Russula earlei]